ncbi:MAG: hypothetical protein FH759_04730 [Sediminimonas qiaohouensis]|uniref:Lipoprotein n=1 Tax=Sediminimonas qiaohouensis TaxID=552061 RepID=A0A7C9HA48_9RHOB|nr:hypothetical protein [Sediminimonas qiaohouensis]MTJ03989.1 hypothetical protein [Sediminimonas qiaohouensis]
MRHLIVLMAAVALTGCYKHLELDTEPTGAMVTQEGGPRLITPTSIAYPTSRSESGCVKTKPLTLTWASGAKTTYKPELCGDATSVSKTIQRPPHPGLYRDRMEGRRRMEEIRAQQAMFAAQMSANALQSFSNGMQSFAPKPSIGRIECESRMHGYTVETTCD